MIGENLLFSRWSCGLFDSAWIAEVICDFASSVILGRIIGWRSPSLVSFDFQGFSEYILFSTRGTTCTAEVITSIIAFM